MSNLVPVAPLREQVEALLRGEGVSWSTIAKSLGWVIPPSSRFPYERGDVTRLKRRLGISPSQNGKGLHGVSQSIRYDLAVEIVRKLDLDPVDCGV